MKYVLGLDFETTFTDPVDPTKAQIIEIGAVLWDVKAKTPEVIVSRTVWDKSYPFDPRITKLTGLTLEHLERFGTHPVTSLEKLGKLMDYADAVVAHNLRWFDQIVLDHESARLGVPMPKKHGIDTMFDLPYPEEIVNRKLKYLPVDHGIMPNPYPHRAVFDVLSMLKVMSCYDFDQVLARSQQPDVTLRACVPPPWHGRGGDGGIGNKIAKEQGYRYTGEPHKYWVKQMKLDQVEEATAKIAPYRTELVTL